MLFEIKQVESVELTFNAKITSIDTSDSLSGSGYKDFRAGYSTQKTAKTGAQDKREFSLKVVVKAREGKPPDGFKRMLDFLSNARTDVLDEDV